MDNEQIAKVIMPLSKCKPGMILLQSIVDIDTGSTIVGKNQVLTQDILERIQKFKYSEIWVGINGEHNLWQVEEKVLQTYKKYIQVLKNIIGNKPDGRRIPVKEVEVLARCIVEEFTSFFDLLACVNLTKKMDQDIYTHSVNVTFLSLLIARWVGFNHEKLENIALAALLHDIGKMDIPNPLIDYTRDLSLKDKIQFRRHPILGYEKLLTYKELDQEVLKAVLMHHERCDGSGYPLNLVEDRISDIARIIGLADEYDHLRESKNIFEIVKVLKCDMIRKFDISMLLEFCSNVINYYIGESVLLNTGEIAEIVFIQPHALHRPIVKVKEKYIDLYENLQVEIIEVL